MSFFTRIKYAISRFMQGRNGSDQYSLFLVYAALALNLLSLIPYLGLLSYAGLIVLIYATFRMFSKNVDKRRAENAKYLEKRNAIKLAFSQARARFKNRKEYKYFKCPKCRAWLKLKRGAGEGTITCGKCGAAFKQRA